MDEFRVDTRFLRGTSTAFKAVADAYPQANTFLANIRVEGAGRVHADIAEGVDRVRTQLGAVYGASGPFPRWYAAAQAALWDLAVDYDGVDARVAAELDAKMPETANDRSSYGLSPDDEEPGVTVPELTGILVAPSDGSFEGYGEWRAVVDAVQLIASLAWVVKGVDVLIKMLGGPSAVLENVNDNISDIYSMQWESLEKCAKTVQVLSSFSDRVQDETAASVLELRDHWSGNAATACFVNVGRLDDELGKHEGELQQLYGALHSFAIGMQYCTDFLADALDAMGGSIAELTEEAAEAAVKGAGHALLAKLLWWVEVVVLAIDALFALVGAFCVAFASTHDYDVPVPQVTAYVPPDVDGPGR